MDNQPRDPNDSLAELMQRQENVNVAILAELRAIRRYLRRVWWAALPLLLINAFFIIAVIVIVVFEEFFGPL